MSPFTAKDLLFLVCAISLVASTSAAVYFKPRGPLTRTISKVTRPLFSTFYSTSPYLKCEVPKPFSVAGSLPEYKVATLETNGDNGIHLLEYSNGTKTVLKLACEEKLDTHGHAKRIGIGAGYTKGLLHFKERAAYLVDQMTKLGAGVPFTQISTHFNNLVGSEQEFIPKACQLIEHCADGFRGILSKAELSQLHAIVVLDICIGNSDRHAGNLLVDESSTPPRLVPIDHGLSLCDFRYLPRISALRNPCYFSAEALNQPPTVELKNTIHRIDTRSVMHMLIQNELSPFEAMTYFVKTELLKIQIAEEKSLNECIVDQKVLLQSTEFKAWITRLGPTYGKANADILSFVEDKNEFESFRENFLQIMFSHSQSTG